MNVAMSSSQNHPIIIVSFDDDYAARFVHELDTVCPTVHVSPLMRTLRSSIEALQPSIAVFDLQTIKTEEHSIFEIMESVGDAFPQIRKIAVGHQTMSSQVIAAMKAGAGDFIDRDASPQDIRDCIMRQLRQGRAGHGERTGHVIALTSGRENEGESQIAANLAAHIAATEGNDDVLLLDLNLENSCFEIEFDVEITYSVHDAIDELLRLDKSVLSNVLARHECGLYILPLVTGKRQEDEVSPQELATLLSTLRSLFSIIIITAGCLRNKYCRPYLAPLCDQILIVSRQIIGSVREASEIIADDVVRANGAEKASLLIADYNPDIDLTPTQISARLALPLAGCIPSDWIALANSHNTGLPTVLMLPNNAYARAIRALSRHLLAEEKAGAKAKQHQRTGPFRHLLKRMRRKAA